MDATYTSPVLPVAEVLTVVVTDAVGCLVEGRYRSPGPATYRARARPSGTATASAPEARDGLPINEYKAEVHEFTISDPAGDAIDLTAEVNDIVNRAPQAIRAAASPMSSSAGRRDQRGGRRRGRVRPMVPSRIRGGSETGTIGTLFIDRIRCIDFNFALTVLFVQGREGALLEVQYTAKGTTSSTRGHEVPRAALPRVDVQQVPADEPPVPQCEGTDLELVIRATARSPRWSCSSPVVSGGDQPVAFLWEVQDGVLRSPEGKRRDSPDPPEPIEKLVRLTAFTEGGCTVTLEEVIDITKPDG